MQQGFITTSVTKENITVSSVRNNISVYTHINSAKSFARANQIVLAFILAQNIILSSVLLHPFSDSTSGKMGTVPLSARHKRQIFIDEFSPITYFYQLLYLFLLKFIFCILFSTPD